MSSVIFSGSKVKALKPGIQLKDQATIWSGAVDPSVSGFAGALGDMYLSTSTYQTYKKTGATNTDWTLQPVSISGDISPTSFSLANNQVAAANVTGLAFANASIRSFIAQISVFIDATSDLFQVVTLTGVQKGADWDYTMTTAGDNSQVTFSMTAAGQVQYTTPSYAGFVSGKLSFRASVTLV